MRLAALTSLHQFHSAGGSGTHTSPQPSEKGRVTLLVEFYGQTLKDLSLTRVDRSND